MACLQIEFTHLGVYKFKGVGTQTVMQINSGAFSGREYPDKAVSSKAEHVSLNSHLDALFLGRCTGWKRADLHGFCVHRCLLARGLPT